MITPIVTFTVTADREVAALRRRARRVAELLGFESQDQARIATAVSEIARNAVGYAGRGQVGFALQQEAPQSLVITVTDEGPGIDDVDAVLGGRFRSPTGAGLGIIGARRMMDSFDLTSAPGGTTVTLTKRFSRRQPRIERAAVPEIAERIAGEPSDDFAVEMGDQNRALMRAMDELRAKQDELAALNAELQDTNRGVVALHAELEEKAEELRRASELKSRFLSDMSHEFRTPLNSIMALSRLLLDQADGPLTEEQGRQVNYIRDSATMLTDLVNDLLDIAKVEAGKIELRPREFTVEDLFAGLRGTLKPLKTSDAVDVLFIPPAPPATLFSDEGKVSQVLRNFISNALKFTERGSVRISAEIAGDEIVFAVRDTGVGIAAEHLETIFEEFAQIENRLQAKVKGTGLGLSLSRKLARLLGGDVWVESEPGKGSTFHLRLPVGEAPAPAVTEVARPADRPGVLVVDDEEAFRYVLRHLIGGSYELIEAADGIEGLDKARAARPAVIFLDLQMPRLDGFGVLAALGADPALCDVPVVISTSSVLEAPDRARLVRAKAILPKATLSRESVTSVLHEVLRSDS